MPNRLSPTIDAPSKTTRACDTLAEPPADATSESLLRAFFSTRILPAVSKPVFGAIFTGRQV
jgi:hypothetical protein